MNLPAIDETHLRDRGYSYEVTVEANMTCVVLRGWPLPSGYDRATADLLIRVGPGYPDTPPDMWWFDPAVRLANRRTIKATEVMERHLGRSWQRWSRHLDRGQWQSGVDGVESFLALISRELARSAKEPGR